MIQNLLLLILNFIKYSEGAIQQFLQALNLF